MAAMRLGFAALFAISASRPAAGLSPLQFQDVEFGLLDVSDSLFPEDPATAATVRGVAVLLQEGAVSVSEEPAAAEGVPPVLATTFHQSLPPWAALTFTVVLFALIAVAYRAQGPSGIATLLLYICAVIACQLTVREVMMVFRHPVFLTTLHFLSSWVVLLFIQSHQITEAGAFVGAVGSVVGGAHQEELIVPSHQGNTKLKALTPAQQALQFYKRPKQYMTRIAPIAIVMFGTIVFNNTSLLYIGAGLNSLIGILTPLTTALLAASLGCRIALFAWAGMAVAIAGDSLISLAEYRIVNSTGADPRAVLIGICFGVGAMLCRSTKSVLQDVLMNDYGGRVTHHKLNPIDLWALQAPLLISMSLGVSLFMEGLNPWYELRALPHSTWGFIFLSCFSAVILNVGGTFVIKMLGAPAAQIAAKLNVLVTSCLAAAFMGETMTLLECAGALIVVLGTALFEKFQRADREEQTRLKESASKDQNVDTKDAFYNASERAIMNTEAQKFCSYNSVSERPGLVR